MGAAVYLASDIGAARAMWRTANNIPARDTPSWRMVDAAGDRRARLLVFDVIGGWDLDARQFVETVHRLDVDGIDLHINSPGGFVYDAVAMFEALRTHSAPVDVHIDGLAASAASYLAMVGDTVEIAKAGRMMIHDAAVIAYGNAAELRASADLLDMTSDNIAQAYADRAGGKATDWRTAMIAETWYTSAQAVDAGLADQVAGAVESGSTNRSRLIKARAHATVGSRT